MRVVDFDSFTVFMLDPKNYKGSLKPKLKGANVWPFYNACSKVVIG